MKAEVSVKIYYFILLEVRQKGGGNSCKGKISRNDATRVSLYEVLAESM